MAGERERGLAPTHIYFFLDEDSGFFELSDFELAELSAFDESSGLDLESLLEAESPFDEDDAEPVEDFLA